MIALRLSPDSLVHAVPDDADPDRSALCKFRPSRSGGRMR